MPSKMFLYEKVFEQLKQRIQKGEYPPGKKLPSESELEQEFAVSTITIKKALAILAENKLITRIPGKGTFVSAVVSSYSSQQKLIGLVLEHVASPFGLSLLYALDQLATEHNYKLCIRFSYGKRDNENKELAFLLSLGVEGLIIMPSHGEHYNPEILKLVLNNFPLVLVDKKMRGIDVPSVRTDNSGAVYQLVKHLYTEGCRHIALLSPDEKNATSLQERRQGFYRGIEDLGLQHYGECKLISNDDFAAPARNSSRVEEIYHFLKFATPAMDGIILSEYSIVPEFVQACRALGKDPWQRYRVCCIDEDYLAPDGPKFTHMKQDEATIASVSIDMLSRQLQQRDLAGREHLVPAIFVPLSPH